jgi:hypothetical protein
MSQYARVCWIEQNQPWVLETQLISTLDLPLNIQQNQHNAFYLRLKAIRRAAKAEARRLPIINPRRRAGNVPHACQNEGGTKGSAGRRQQQPSVGPQTTNIQLSLFPIPPRS